MRFGLSTPSFSGAYATAGRSPDPRTPSGLIAMATGWNLDVIELSVKLFEGHPARLFEEFAAEVAEKKLTVVLDTSGTAVPEEIGGNVKTALDAAATIGAPVVRTTISQCLEGDRSRYGFQGWKDHLAALVDPLKEAAARARDLGINVGVENHQDLCSAEMRWLCEQVDNPHFGVVMDCGNAFAVGEHPATFADRVMPYLKHVHLKDYVVHPSPSGWQFVRCPLGAGVVDFSDLITRFDAGAPAVLGCIELGASSARHIRLLEDDWWATFEPRPWQENLAAIRALHAGQQAPGLDWRTPRERGADAAVIADYETEQAEASVEYLRGLR